MPTEIFAISGLINGIFAISFGLVVLFKGRKERINQLFFLMTVALAIWAFSYWQWLLVSDMDSALFWVRLLSFGSIFIPVFYLHWVLYLLGLSERKKYLIGALYFASALLSIYSFSELFVEDVQPKLFFPFWPEPGILYHFYLVLLYIGIAIYSLFLLVKVYRSSTDEKRGQILYVRL